MEMVDQQTQQQISDLVNAYALLFLSLIALFEHLVLLSPSFPFSLVHVVAFAFMGLFALLQALAGFFSPRVRSRENRLTLTFGVYAARISDCRSCPLRTQCQGHGTSTNKPRRVSAVLHPQPQSAPQEHPPPCLPATHPILWDDWGRGSW